MKRTIVFICMVLCLFLARAIIAQSVAASSSAFEQTSAPLPSPKPATTSETADLWYANAANIGLLATLLSVFATVFYTVLTASIVRYMRRQTMLQKRVNDVQTFEMIVRRLEATRADRALIRDYIRAGKVTIPPSSPTLEAVDRVCREFDFLGLMDRKKLVDHELVDEFYSSPFVLLYEQLLGKYTDFLRDDSRRGYTHFWELVQFYERVRHVPANHPGRIPGAKDWPANPRIDDNLPD